MDQNNGLEAKISREETRTLLMIDLEVPLPLTRISLQGQTLPMGITIRTTEHHMTVSYTHLTLPTKRIV